MTYRARAESCTAPCPATARLRGFAPAGRIFLTVIREKELPEMTATMKTTYDIGDRVTVAHRGEQLTGRVVGVEDVTDFRRGVGLHLVIQTEDYRVVDVPASAVVAGA